MKAFHCRDCKKPIIKGRDDKVHDAVIAGNGAGIELKTLHSDTCRSVGTWVKADGKMVRLTPKNRAELNEAARQRRIKAHQRELRMSRLKEKAAGTAKLEGFG